MSTQHTRFAEASPSMAALVDFRAPDRLGRRDVRAVQPNSVSSTPNANADTSATARAQHFCLPVGPRCLLEPDAVKVARPVLRGAGRSNAPGPPTMHPDDTPDTS